MPVSARDEALALIENLHMRREHWALACNINLPAHDTRVNTFVEIQNACLMDVVQVSKSMGLQTMVCREAQVVDRRDRKFAHKNFRTLNTARSRPKNELVLSQVCSVMQDLMTTKVGKKFTREVEVALSCLENIDSKWSRCKGMCKLCNEDMTDMQKLAACDALVFHMVLRKGTDCADIDNGLKYNSLGQEWDDLHDSIPRMKYTRIITAQKTENGKWLFMCSCGFDFRYQGTCKHISTLLLHASDHQCAGCELENIALRNTAAFAACRDEALISRDAFDWKGVICGHVSEDSLNVCPCPIDEEDDEGRGHECDDDGHDWQNSSSRKPTRKSSAEVQLKAKREARMKEIQDHFYRVKAKLDSCKMADFWGKADNVDGHILDAFRELGGVADVAQTVVAGRYRDDPKRHKRPANVGLQRTNKVAVAACAAAIAGGSASAPAAAAKQGYAVIHISDSEELEVFDEEIRDGGGSSSD